MNRWTVLALAGVTAAFGNYAAMQPYADPPVNLQAVSPGVQQVGNINLSGVILSKSLVSTNSTSTGRAVSGVASSPTGVTYGGYFQADSSNGRAVYGLAGSSTGFNFGGYFETPSPNGKGVFASASGTSGVNYGVHGRSASVSGRGVFGEASSTTGSNFGVYGRTFSDAGRGVFGESVANAGGGIGGFFQSAGDVGRGLVGIASSPSGTTYGVYGRAVSPSGFGVFCDGNLGVTGVIGGNGLGLTNVNATLLDGLDSSSFLSLQQTFPGTPQTGTINLDGRMVVSYEVPSPNAVMKISNTSVINGSTLWCESAGTNGIGVFCNNSATTGYAYGGLFQAASPDGRAIFAANSATSGMALAGRFANSSPDGRVIYCSANSDSGFNYGVYSETLSGDGSAVYGAARYEVVGGQGVYGEAFSRLGGYGVLGTKHGFNGYAVYANGSMGASGVKPFRIDHPFDPENKYLLHYATESPSPQNFYVGNVVTDAQGYAWVQLPDYFAEINKNFKYQLTVVGKSFAQAVVWEEIKGNRFQIRTNEPNIKVSWRVDADRNDRFVRAAHPKDVEDKVGREKGTYQQPELYGLGPERGMNYDPARAATNSRVTPLK